MSKIISLKMMAHYINSTILVSTILLLALSSSAQPKDEKWLQDNRIHEKYIAGINKESKGVLWKFRDKYSVNRCYERLAYLSTYLYKRKIGKAKTCISADSCLGIKIWMDLNRRRVKSMRDFVRIPNIFNHTLHPEKIVQYEKIAEMIGEQVYKDVIKDEHVKYSEFVIIYFRAKKCEKSFCCIVVKDGGKCFAKHSYFLPEPIY